MAARRLVGRAGGGGGGRLGDKQRAVAFPRHVFDDAGDDL